MNPVYEALLNNLGADAAVERVCLGLNWTMAEVEDGAGFAFSPRQVPRTLNWAGTLRGRPVHELASWVLSWDAAQASVGLAVLGAAINRHSKLQTQATALHIPKVPDHLQVFAHFRPQVEGKKVVVVGHYPKLEELWADVPYQCLERHVQEGDFPDTAAEYLLPEADWAFITASSLANKSLPRLLALAEHAKVVLMGPSMPWFDGWKDFGVDYVAGVRMRDAAAALSVVAEGGGTRLFAGPVEYALHALDTPCLP